MDFFLAKTDKILNQNKKRSENLRSYRIKPYRPVGSKKSDQETDESINSKTKKNQSDGEEKNNLSESQSTKDSASQSRPLTSVTKNPASIATTATKKSVPPPPNKSHTKQNESKKDNSSSTEKTVSNASIDQSPSTTETNSSVAPAKVIQTPSKLPAVPKAPLRSSATNSPSNQSSVSVSINNTTEDQNLENLNSISAQNLKKRKAPDSSISVELEPSTKKRAPQFKSDEEKEPTATTLSSLKHSSGIESRWMAPVSSIDPMTMSLPEIEMEINFITPSIDYLKKALAKS